MSFTKSLDKLPWIVRFLLALPVLDGIVYGIYRILKGRLLIGILWIFIGAAVGWIVDMICIVLYGKVTLFT